MKIAHTIAIIAASSFLTIAVAQAAPDAQPMNEIKTGRSAMMMHHHHYHHHMMHKRHMMMMHKKMMHKHM